MKNKIGVINYGSGNYKSVCNALDFLKIDRVEILKKEDFLKVEHVILPGVGTYVNCINRLESMDIFDTIKYEIPKENKFFLGICIGMQILVDFGVEHEMQYGLGIIQGGTEKINSDIVKVPHVGWNEVKLHKESKLFNHLPDNPDFYFTHSYYVKTKDFSHVSSSVSYGGSITSSIEKNNIYGVQFHPEKSQENGLQLLRNFSNLG
jgi:glutamine amidotransferase